MSRRRITRVLALVAVAAGVAFASSACAAPPKPYADVWGDSLMVQAHDPFVFGLHNMGYDHTNVNAYGGTAPCDWLSSIQAAAKANPKPRIAILEFAGNNYTACTHRYTGQQLQDEYNNVIAAEVLTLEHAGIRTYVLSTPATSPAAQALHPDISNPDLMQAEHNGTLFGGGTWLDSGGQQNAPIVNPDGTFAQVLPCTSWETGSFCGTAGPGHNIMRSADGIHFCPTTVGNNTGVTPTSCPVYDSGAMRYALYTALMVGHP
jgi:hypothetical protein